MSQKTEKVPDFSKFAIVFNLQPLQYRIFSPLQQHYSLPFARRYTYRYRRSKFVVTLKKMDIKASFGLEIGTRTL